MHVLIVLAHPLPDSYTAAVAGALRSGIEKAGTAEIADLHAEGFDPRFTAADHAHYLGAEVPADIAREHVRLERADALALVFPVYWWSYPGMLKGWIDRVFTSGWAYSIDAAATSTGILQNRPTVQLLIGGSRAATYAKYGYDRALHVQQEIGIFGYCGLTDVESHHFFDVEGDANAQRRSDLLGEARRIGAALISGTRALRSVEFGWVRPAQ